MIDLSKYEVWFATGSQHLYGPEALNEVADHANKIAVGLNESGQLPVKVVCKPVLTTREQIANLADEANATPNCIGLVFWMHTFSPAKMWIGGLTRLKKPFAHLHTHSTRHSLVRRSTWIS